MHKLVCSGMARPGQTSRELLDSLALDLLLDFAYGMLIENSDTEGRAKIDSIINDTGRIPKVVDDTPIVEVKKKDGTVVHISEGRLAQIRRNQGGLRKMKGRTT